MSFGSHEGKFQLTISVDVDGSSNRNMHEFVCDGNDTVWRSSSEAAILVARPVPHCPVGHEVSQAAGNCRTGVSIETADHCAESANSVLKQSLRGPEGTTSSFHGAYSAVSRALSNDTALSTLPVTFSSCWAILMASIH